MLFAPEKTYPHGTRSSYTNNGCRCPECTQAEREYARAYYHASKDPDRPGRLVSAHPSREHLRVLSLSGIGKRRVAELTGIPVSTIDKIRRGERRRITQRNSEAILAIEVDEQALGAMTGREQAEAIIARLSARGWPRYRIAAALGSTAKTPALQVGRGERVLRRTVEKLRVLEQLDLRGLLKEVTPMNGGSAKVEG